MRATRIEVLNERDRVPLVVHGRIERTFLGLGLFVAAVLLLCGAYLLMEAIRDPLEASGTTVLTAGFMLALASFVITFLIWPRRKMALARDDEDLDQVPEYIKSSVLTVYGESAQNRIEAKQALGTEKDLPGPM